MAQGEETKMLLTCTDVVELVEVWKIYAVLHGLEQGLTEAEINEASTRYDWHLNKAARGIRAMKISERGN